MKKMKDGDFNNPPKEVMFDLCMESVEGYLINDITQNEINREDFRDLLVRYNLQSYSALLLDYQIKWIDIQKIFSERRKRYDDNEENVLPQKLELSRIIRMFLTREIANTNDLQIIVSGLYKIDIAGGDLLNNLKESFIKEFERLGLNETRYTKDEAIEAIHNGEDDEWLFNNGFDIDEILADPELVTDEFIESYRTAHYKPREISLKLVKEVISELEMRQDGKKRKVGPKIKNLGIGGLAKRLSLLQRINEFLNQNTFTLIKDFPLSNKTCRFIYEYLDFWHLLYDHVIFERSEKVKRGNYIKSLIRNYEDYFKKGNLNRVRDYTIIDKNFELRIDLFKKVKDGLISPEEFHKRMSFM